jgi:hypothetical protein
MGAMLMSKILWSFDLGKFMKEVFRIISRTGVVDFPRLVKRSNFTLNNLALWFGAAQRNETLYKKTAILAC